LLFTDTYQTIQGPTEFIFKSKGSKFLAFAYPVNSGKEVKQKLEELRRTYPDASHHCYAYVLNYDKSLFRTNDDGEPSNTAGKPILRQIHKKDLTNILVVVVRYFGGTLLGVPGLIEAYGESTTACLAICGITQHKIREKYELSCDFGLEKDIYKLCRQFQLDLSVIQNQECFCAEIKIPLQQTGAFKEQVKAYYQVSIKYTGIE
jgi:uncharacterized YigZ family protein